MVGFARLRADAIIAPRSAGSSYGINAANSNIRDAFQRVQHLRHFLPTSH